MDSSGGHRTTDNESKHEDGAAKIGSNENEEAVFCSVKADEVPPVPDNKFLKRRVATEPSATTNDRSKRDVTSDGGSGDRDHRRSDRSRYNNEQEARSGRSNRDAKGK